MSNQNQNQSQFKHVPAGTGPAYCGPGDRITYLITGAETGGTFFMAEVSVVPGGGPPPHVHSREDESFYVQQGTLAVQVGDKALNASAGDFVHMPRGVVHSFKNAGREIARLLMVATPAGLENYFAETFFPAADVADVAQIGQAVIARAMKNAPKFGLELLLPTENGR
ncbi:MAG TPA: quercetin 2,3-dioxygenase [Bryobacteraceae bacterium]|nr:quercetin 2,3-dioxygenase [Bryobacteraceae bacterium]